MSLGTDLDPFEMKAKFCRRKPKVSAVILEYGDGRRIIVDEDWLQTIDGMLLVI